jgi:protein gp37
MAETTIEWTDATWNPTTGCDRVSAGCDSCYALTMAKRLKAMGNPKYQRDGNPKTSGPGFGISEHMDMLDEPFGWRKPRRIFVNSMSDLFHDGVTDRFIGEVFNRMCATPHHTYQLLTKRHGRMRSLLRRWANHATVGCTCPTEGGGCSAPVDVEHGQWPLSNVWLGVSVEDQERAELRVPALLETPAAVRFLSCEPLLGPVDLKRAACRGVDEYGRGLTSRQVHWGCCEKAVSKLDWVIVGGESGPDARPMHPDWARSLRDQCQQAGVPFFMKQAGAVLARTWGCSDRKGHDPAEWPETFPREFPRRPSATANGCA